MGVGAKCEGGGEVWTKFDSLWAVCTKVLNPGAGPSMFQVMESYDLRQVCRQLDCFQQAFLGEGL